MKRKLAGLLTVFVVCLCAGTDAPPSAVAPEPDNPFPGEDTLRRYAGLVSRRAVEAVPLRAENASAVEVPSTDNAPVLETLLAEAGADVETLSTEAVSDVETPSTEAAPDVETLSPSTETNAVESAQEAGEQIPYSDDFWLTALGDNPRKRLLIFGNEYTETVAVTEAPELPEGVTETPEPVETVRTVTRTEIRYDTPEEAESHMTTLEVPVWNLNGQDKVSGTLYLTVNSALAEDVRAIFAEIYDDPERFPFSDGGGYSWRTNSRSEHIQGTAIDLNVDANYQVRDGAALVGTHWTPGDDPYSIPPDGSVVRVFAAHGWDWGGNAWADNADPAYGYHDYMHFSYFGR